MAQVRQQDEEYQSAMLNCYAEHGLKGTKASGAGNVGLRNVFDANGQWLPGMQELVEATAKDCNARVPAPDHYHSGLDDASYQRMLDVRACIIAHGYDVPEPPTAEAWKDSSPSESAWNPYEATFGRASGVSVSFSEVRSLMDACPQSGPSFYVEVPNTDDDG